MVYTFNNNGLTEEQMRQTEQELGVTIHTVPLPRWFRIVFKYHLLFIRLFLKYPIHHYVKLPQRFVEEIKAQQPDLIWVYGAEWSRVTRQFDGYRRLHTMPDSEALYYYRMLGQRFVTRDWKQYWRCALMYPKFLALERDYATDETITYHLVGEEDANFLRQMNPGIQVRFLRHPHYAVRERGEIRFHQPKIRLLVAGQYNLYMQQTADEVLEYLTAISHKPLAISPSPSDTLLSSPPKGGAVAATTDSSPFRGLGGQELALQALYSITFLGKGWERHVAALRELGFEVEHIKFAPDYIEEIIKHDIQVTPITIGTGTKGKVLDALANGLLVLGTPMAMENIAVKHGESCVVWQTPQQLVAALHDIARDPARYEAMAAAGRTAVLTHHNPTTIAKQLFGD